MVQENHYDPWGLGLPLNAGSEKVGGSPEDRFKFIERESQRETNWIDLQARFYDPQIGRFLAVDPLTEGQDAFSPYHYSFNNPIRFSDPDGRFPECCGGVGDFLTGVVQAVNENAGWGNPVTAQPGYVEAYNAGRRVGQYASIAIGAAEVAGGAFGLGAAAGAEVGSGGLATPVVAVIAPGSIALVAHGGKTAMNAIDNLKNDKGRVNADGKSTKYENKTGKESVHNRETDVGKSQFEKNLQESGYNKTQSKDGKVQNYTKGEKKYTVRDNAKSTGEATADAYKNGELKTKIRLEKK